MREIKFSNSHDASMYNKGYEQGRADLIKQFDESAYMIIHVSEYGEHMPCCYQMADIEKKLEEQNN